MVDCSHLFSFLGYQIIALLPKGLYALLSVNQWKGCVFNFHRRHRFRIYVNRAYYLKISITLQPILSHFFITSKLSN